MNANSTTNNEEQTDRTAVVEGERMWNIPENWDTIVIAEHDVRAEGIYHIPETDVYVHLNISTNDHPEDSWHSVESVGSLNVKFGGDVDQGAIVDEIGGARDDIEDNRVNDILTDLADPDSDVFDMLEFEFYEFLHQFQREMYMGMVPDTGMRLTGSFDVETTAKFPLDEVVRGTFDVTFEEAEEIAEYLTEVGAFPAYPTLTASVDGEVSEEYVFTALIEAGCTPAEALDYWMTEVSGMSQTEWAGTRGKDQSTVSGNVNSARRKLAE